MKHFLLKVLFLCLFAQLAHAQSSRTFSITDIKTNDAILSVSDDKTSTSAGGIKVEQQLDETGNPQTWKTTITNTSKEQRRLIIKWEVSWDGSSTIDKLHYWNGNKPPVNGQQLLSAAMAETPPPSSVIQTIYDDKKGIALTLDPLKVTPVFQQSLKRNFSTFYLHLQIPLVLDAGESDTFPIEIYQFTPRYGFLDALQKYFSVHPKAFIASKNIDPKPAGVGAVDYMLLSSYRYGKYPSPELAEDTPGIAPELPLLKEVVNSGWQAVPAARAANGDLPDFIWPARYGSGLGSFITIGNASDENWSGQIVIDDDYLGPHNYLFVKADGTPLSQSMNGRTTVINLQVASHETLVLRAISEVSRFAQGGATVSWKDDGAKGQLTIESTFAPSKTIAPRDGWKETSVSDGKVWDFDSAYFDSPVADIQNFPFFGGAKNALIVLPTDPSPEETWTAEHIQQYFQLWGKKGIKPEQDITLKIISGLAPRDADQPLVYIGDILQKIHTKGMVLQVGKSDAVSLKEATIQLLNTLDQKYFYNGDLPRGGLVVAP